MLKVAKQFTSHMILGGPRGLSCDEYSINRRVQRQLTDSAPVGPERYLFSEADLRFEAHSDHIIVGVGVIRELRVFGRIEHPAFCNHRHFDADIVFGAQSNGIEAIGQITNWH